ncbi:MAG: FAD-dependent oxidoreductase [Balneolaceae bacterium]|nr:FAD-dependent oxidoreductase [Balneolaceae bacterium]
MAAAEKEHIADILVAGAGFAGTLTALCLNQCGFDVCLVEKDAHPRFAVGESSTPIADMILRELSERYDLPWLSHFSRYGSWQQHHPGITCGIKRGFSYYQHFAGIRFHTDAKHRHELLVAASASNEHSDTNWLRSEFDAFLARKALDDGITYIDNTELRTGHYHENGTWTFRADHQQREITLKAEFFIDATGSPALLHDLLGITSGCEKLDTASRAVFSHFEQVTPWCEYLGKQSISTDDYPYNPDFSALHHLLEEGWLWMLRFNNDRTSAGLLVDMNSRKGTMDLQAEREWQAVVEQYPSVSTLFQDAVYSDNPGRLIRTGRLQRMQERGSGDGWVALPHTIGFVDPLHSTGIAHTLSGVERILAILESHWNDKQKLGEHLCAYQRQVRDELSFVDTLVSGCYRCLPHFELFNIWSMFYFTAAIHYEQCRLRGEIPEQFLSAGHQQIRKLVDQSYRDLIALLESGEPPHESAVTIFKEKVKDRIEPYNSAGLLDPRAANMYHHTVAEI